MISLKEMMESNKFEEKTTIPDELKMDDDSKQKGVETSNNCDDSDLWALLLLYLMWMQENENEKLWKDFKEQIKYKTRFFPKSELLNKIDNISEYATVDLCKGTVLYRAREYKNSDFLDNKAVIAVYEKLNDFFPNLKLQIEDVKSDAVLNILSLAIGGNANRLEELQLRIIEALNEEKPFWGFDEKNCDAPPNEYATAGRANSLGVSFLYAATDKKTAIMEMRPQIGQHFNVCKIETFKDIRIFDFTYISSKLKDDEYVKSGDLYAISKEFSRPNYGDTDDYVPTQYLCEYLREKGFDGIRYKSAVSPNGINLIIFDTNSENKAYKIVESSVYAVNNIDIEFGQILPVEFEDVN